MANVGFQPAFGALSGGGRHSSCVLVGNRWVVAAKHALYETRYLATSQCIFEDPTGQIRRFALDPFGEGSGGHFQIAPLDLVFVRIKSDHNENLPSNYGIEPIAEYGYPNIGTYNVTGFPMGGSGSLIKTLTELLMVPEIGLCRIELDPSEQNGEIIVDGFSGGAIQNAEGHLVGIMLRGHPQVRASSILAAVGWLRETFPSFPFEEICQPAPSISSSELVLSGLPLDAPTLPPCLNGEAISADSGSTLRRTSPSTPGSGFLPPGFNNDQVAPVVSPLGFTPVYLRKRDISGVNTAQQIISGVPPFAIQSGSIGLILAKIRSGAGQNVEGIRDSASTKRRIFIGNCFLVAPQWILTAHSVLDSPELAAGFEVVFGCQVASGTPSPVSDDSIRAGILDSSAPIGFSNGSSTFFCSLDGSFSEQGTDLAYQAGDWALAKLASPISELVPLEPAFLDATSIAFEKPKVALPYFYTNLLRETLNPKNQRDPFHPLGVLRSNSFSDSVDVVQSLGTSGKQLSHTASASNDAKGAPLVVSSGGFVGIHTQSLPASNLGTPSNFIRDDLIARLSSLTSGELAGEQITLLN